MGEKRRGTVLRPNFDITNVNKLPSLKKKNVPDCEKFRKMPKVRLGRSAGSGSSRRRPPPEGWELIEPTLEELEGKMREAETESHEGKRKVIQRHSNPMD